MEERIIATGIIYDYLIIIIGVILMLNLYFIATQRKHDLYHLGFAGTSLLSAAAGFLLTAIGIWIDLTWSKRSGGSGEQFDFSLGGICILFYLFSSVVYIYVIAINGVWGITAAVHFMVVKEKKRRQVLIQNQNGKE